MESKLGLEGQRIAFRKQMPNKDGLWLWRLLPASGMGIISLKGSMVTELTVFPLYQYRISDWWEKSQEIVETYYCGKGEQ